MRQRYKKINGNQDLRITTFISDSVACFRSFTICDSVNYYRSFKLCDQSVTNDSNFKLRTIS